MSRLGNIFIAGYYPCPVKVVRAIGALLRYDTGKLGRISVVDPCAGDGEAVVELAAAIDRTTVRRSTANIYACEMEAGRATSLARRLHRDRRPERGRAVHSDAFRLRWEGGRRHDQQPLRAGVVWLNPIYAHDPMYGRTEERWLRHFLSLVHPEGGVLVFVIPITAISASAETIAQNFTGVTTFRFPDPHYDRFKQVVILAKRREATHRPDPRVVAELLAYAADPAQIPVLPVEGAAPLFMVPTLDDNERIAAIVQWEVRPLDADAISAAFRPWRFGEKADRPVPGVLPENGVGGYTTETFTVALPLRAGYVAPALAVGVFDGVRITPDDRASGLPPVFAKATFVRDWTDVPGGCRTNEEGETISILQVQQPRLIMTALDLRTGKYVQIPASLERRSTTDLREMTAADFLAAYQGGLLATLRQKCTPIYDPANDNDRQPEWRIARPLWRAQAITATAALRSIEQHGASLIEGETGTGKSSMGVAIASTMMCKRTFGRVRQGVRRALIVCPPHLLAEWLDEIAALRPDARATVIHDLPDAIAFATGKDDQTVFGLLAETTGKLTHGWAGLGDPDAQPVHVEPGEDPDAEETPARRRGRAQEPLFAPAVGPETHAHRATFLTPKRHALACPTCGAAVTGKHKDLASKRVRCTAQDQSVHSAHALLIEQMARTIAPVFPTDEPVVERLRGRVIRQMLVRWQKLGEDPVVEQERRWRRVQAGGFRTIARAAVLATANGDVTATSAVTLVKILGAADDVDTTVWAVRLLLARASAAQDEPHAAALRHVAGYLPALVRDLPTGLALIAEMRAQDPNAAGRRHHWTNLEEVVRKAHGERVNSYQADFAHNGEPILYGQPQGSSALAFAAFEALRHGVPVEEGDPCGEALYAAVPRPRRVPIAEYLAKKHGHRIDLVIVDEIHEASDLDSAQAQAMEQFRGRPMLGLTGTISNGYAASLFAILHTFSPAFRLEFKRDDIALFRERYGYQKRILQDLDRETKRPVAFGSVSSRVIRSAKAAGDSPGALPSFLLRHFLPLAVPIHLKDLECEILPCEERVEYLDPGPELGPAVRRFVDTLVDQIAQDRFTPLQGKLFGQMSEAWSAADRATLGIGNSEDGIYRACYPESVGGAEVVRLKMQPAEVLLPKEQRMVEIVREELAEGRNVLICAWHAKCGLYERLAKILKDHVGVDAPILDCDKVPARGRKAWLKSKVVDKGARAMIVTSASIETGFNALVHFHTLLWYQPPGCAPRVARQTRGRVRRPGQKKPQRFIWLVYKNTPQVYLYQLLQLKIAESLAVDGDDPTAALRNAGIEPINGVSGMDLGRALYAQVQQERGRAA